MLQKLISLATCIRALTVEATTAAGSGHLTSSLSATDLMVALMYGGTFKYDVAHPDNPNNDRLIFSKGHASPLFYALWACAGGLPLKDLLTFRKFESPLEGHPSRRFPFTEVATGSLGQGLSVGLGMALNASLDKLNYTTYVLLGDSEMSEGSNWEAMQLASHYTCGNLVGLIDMNGLGQQGETMYSTDAQDLEKKIKAFGWDTHIVDGHDMAALIKAFSTRDQTANKPTMIIAQTIKGKGVSFIEDKVEWHGRTLNEQEAARALTELGYLSEESVTSDKQTSVETPATSQQPDAPPITKPDDLQPVRYTPSSKPAVQLEKSEAYTVPLAPRKAYGHALVKLHPENPDMVVLDAEVSNSTFSDMFKKAYPKRFYEMYIAEQNMVGVAAGLARRGKKPYISTFAAFFTRAYDQLRMSAYSDLNISCVGSHVGVSIGEDGPSQMGLEDFSLFSSLYNSVVMSPADHISTEKLLGALSGHEGISYMRVSRADKPPLYTHEDTFTLGGSKTLQTSDTDEVTVIATGVTVYEALQAAQMLHDTHAINIRVIDAYSIKPIDSQTIQKAAVDTKALITVEDHYPQGGLADAVRAALSERPVRVFSLAVYKKPKSGSAPKLLRYEEIDAEAIVTKVLDVVSRM